MVNERAQYADSHEPLVNRKGLPIRVCDYLSCPNCGTSVWPRLSTCCDVQCRVELFRWRKSLVVKKETYTREHEMRDAKVERGHWVERIGKKKLKTLHSANEANRTLTSSTVMEVTASTPANVKGPAWDGHRARVSERKRTSKLRRDAVRSQRFHVLRHERFNDQQIADFAARLVDETIKHRIGQVTKRKDPTVHRMSSTGV